MRSITLNAPAKINLFLDIINRRADGYHNITTIFQKIALCDRLKVSIIKDRAILLDCKCQGVPTGRANLVYKAASLMMNRFNLTSGVRIQIRKKIPVAAGLGGGSSDAASTILAIKNLFNLKIGHNQLIELAKGIGADVPFFMSGYSCAVGRGIGERLKKLKTRSHFYVLLLIPKIKIYTKTIYRMIKFPLTKTNTDVNMLARILSGYKKNNKLNSFLYNRLEQVVCPKFAVVKEAKIALSLYGGGAFLSGSGPAVFALFNDRKEAIKAQEVLKKDKRWQLILTETT
jgi:4-diphosphocytidyl-2-C-methyl-D-erythritol kinase